GGGLRRFAGGRLGGGGGGLRGSGLGSAQAEGGLDQVDDFLGAFGRTQGSDEVLLHQRTGELRQQRQVFLSGSLRGGDHEHEIGRTVLRSEVDRWVQACQHQAGFGDRLGAGVRDGDASGNSRRRLLLARNRCGGEVIGGTRPTLFGDCGGHGADDSGRLRPLVHVE